MSASRDEAINKAIQVFEIGDVSVTKVVDVVEPMSPKVLYVDKTRDDFAPHLDWLQPHFLDDKCSMLLSIHSLIIKTGQHTVLVDTCVGNHKQEAGFPQWNNREGRYLEDLTAAGCPPESVDYVFCTHMHVDHTGWNTRLADGRWVPTFPNAKYLFNRKEWDAWKDHDGAVEKAVLSQNILPIIESGQVEWVDGQWAIDDAVSLMPTPGHTPGHCSVAIASAKKRAVITGDMMIHPVQIAMPEWQQRADNDKALAVATRTQFIEDHCDEDVLVLGTHFNTPTGLHIVSKGSEIGIRA
jgi:glyoxylase-like metal-dependent hydrolase (beta-lactamase superfamily II)